MAETRLEKARNNARVRNRAFEPLAQLAVSDHRGFQKGPFFTNERTDLLSNRPCGRGSKVEGTVKERGNNEGKRKGREGGTRF